MNLFKKNKKTKKRKSSKKKDSKKQFIIKIVNVILIFLVLIILFDMLSVDKKENKISISELSQKIKSSEVENITVKGEKLEILLKDDQEFESKKEKDTALSETLVNYSLSQEEISSVNIEIKEESGFWFWFGNILPFLIPLLFIGVFLWFITGQMKGAGMKALSFGDSKARIIDPKDKKNKITFKDVAGNKEAKQELEEVVDFLKNPKKFLDIGAKIPKGVLLTGAPGTGKTLLARAVAGEAEVPFFHLSGSEFVEMFVGVGASRVRDLFKMAKKMSPSIIFIDEIDAVGRSRGVGIGGGNDEREQTLNQILVEMDGFDPHEKVIVLAATNRSDVLDPALLRPGRFDRRVILDIPDRDDREKILNIHSRKKPLAKDVNIRVIAERTPGFSGADLESLMNESAILAARNDRKEIKQQDLINSIEKVMIGPERKSHILNDEEKKITAYHEAGHAIVASVLPHADPVHKISIIARGHAGGFTMKLPLEERRLPSRKIFLDEIAMSLGGYSAEMKKFGDITTGPSSDLKVATSIARDMVTKYGMSEKIGPVVFDGITGQRMDMYGTKMRYSDEVTERIDSEVSRIIREAMEKAGNILEEYNDVFEEVSVTLLENESIEQEEYNEILKKHGIIIKGKKHA